MKILGSTKLDFDDVLIRPKSSATASRKHVNLARYFDKFPHSTKSLNCVPIFAANMDTTGSFAMANALEKRNWLTALSKHHSITEQNNFIAQNDNAFISIGITDKDIEKLKNIIDYLVYPPNLCVDVANGYIDYFVEILSEIRSISPKSIIMAGNVATPEMVERLIRQGGADIVKIGIGPGSVCTTRLATGVGYPQLSAILECADAAHGSQNGYICADGGCKTSGDICKAFGANADFVMLGGMLAGTDECDGEWEYHVDKEGGWIREELEHWGDDFVATLARGGGVVNIPTVQAYNESMMDSPHVMLPKMSKQKKSLLFYGMSSYDAQDKYNGGVKEYRGSEGKAVSIPYKGPVEKLCQQIEGGIRSCCAYIGAEKIKDMGKCTTFIRVNNTHNSVFVGGEQWKR